ncbi:hypothetical protein JOC78_001320 [Bacillus ectoiniformans]|nr:hypothetical protein [Bacillus ectoiniformans]
MTDNLRKTTKRTRLTPLGRFVVGFFFFLVTATLGAIVGYSLIGEGNPLEVFLPSTWIHLVEVLINSIG